MKKLLVVAAAAFAALFASSAFAAETIIDVEPGVEEALKTAVDNATPGTTLRLSDGWYVYTGTLNLGDGVKIVSKNGPEKTKIVSRKNGSETTRPVEINHADSVLAGVDVSAFLEDGTASTGRGAVKIGTNGGTVTNCYLCNHSFTGNGSGVGIWLGAGTVVDCLITNNTCTGNSAGVGVWANAAPALVQRCKILYNGKRNSGYGGGFYANAGSHLFNCLIVGNAAGYGAAGYCDGGNTLVCSCTIALNVASDTRSGNHFEDVYPAARTQNCLLWRNYIASTTVRDDKDLFFVDPDHGDFHLRFISPAIDAGSPKKDPATGADTVIGDFDLDGSARVVGAAIDLGCYEYATDGTAKIGIKSVKPVGATSSLPVTNEFTAATENMGDVDPATCWWTFDGTEPTESNHAAAGLVVTNEFTEGGNYRARVKCGVVEDSYALVVKSDKLFVVKGNPNAEMPYASWATAAADVNEALDLLGEGMTLSISNGNYAVTRAAYVVPKNAAIIGVCGPEETTFDVSGIVAGFTLSQAGARMEGVRLYGFPSAVSESIIKMTANATIANCIIDKCNPRGATPVSVSAGLVTDCVFTNINALSWGAETLGNCLTLTGGVVDRCRFVNNIRSISYFLRGMALVSGGSLRNSLFIGNSACGCPGVCVKGTGKVENCTIVRNVSAFEKASNKEVLPSHSALFVDGSNATVVNTVVAFNVNHIDQTSDADGSFDGWENCLDTCSVGTPASEFANAGKNDFHPLPSSTVLTDQGQVLDWMAGAKDLDGNPRCDVYSQTPDIGCYEYTESSEPGVTIFHRNLGTSEFAPQKNEFSAVITPRSLDYDEEDCWWTFDGTEPSESNHQAVGTVVTYDIEAGDATVRFRVKTAAGEIVGADEENWFFVPSDKIYVVKDNPNAQSPYATWKTAAATFGDALAVLDQNMTIVLSNGIHAVTAGFIVLPPGATVRSANGPDVTTLDFDKTVGGFQISRLGNVLDGVCIRNRRSDSAACVTLDVTAEDALVTNCVIDSCGTLVSSPIVASGGLFVDCVVTNGSGRGWTPNEAMAAVICGTAVMDRCRIVNSVRTQGCARGAVCVGTPATPGGTLRNSLVTGCAEYGVSGVYVRRGGRVENCTIAGNKKLEEYHQAQVSMDEPPLVCYVEDASGVVINSIVAGNAAEKRNKNSKYEPTQVYWGVKDGLDAAVCFTNCFLDGDPLFVNPAAGDYSLRNDSPCLDKSVPLDWMTEDSVDLAHHPRLDNGVADLGCFEYWESGEISVQIAKRKLSAGDYTPLTYEFKAVVNPRALEYDPANCWWTFDGTEPSESNHQAVGAVVTNVFFATTETFRTVRFVLKIGDETYADGQEDWIEVRSGEFFLVQENPNAAEPYATWETAATNLKQVLTWVKPNTTLWVSNGTYRMEAAITLPANATIRSVNGPHVTTFNGRSAAPNIMISSGVLSGIRLYGASSTGHNFGGIQMSGGLVTNCIVEKATAMNNYGSALYATGGFFVDSIITNCSCWAGGSGTWPSSARLLGAVTMDRCRIYSSSNTSFDEQPLRGALCLTKNGTATPTVRNTLVAGTRQRGCTGIYVEAGTVENCTVVSNASTTAAETSYAVYAAGDEAHVLNTVVALNVNANGEAANAGGNEGSFDHCAVPGGYGTDTVRAEPVFKNPAKWNFRLRQGSPGVSAGTVLPWMDGALDADGKPRTAYDGTVDIGCYQANHNGLLLLVR